jgi:hypothetical protein
MALEGHLQGDSRDMIRLRIQYWLLRMPWYREWSTRIWAAGMTLVSASRYLRSILEMRRMGMTLEQAMDRAYRWEIKRIEEMKTQWQNETYLARRRIAKVEKEIGRLSNS